MKAYFFKYTAIGQIIQASFPVSRMFRGKEYPFEKNLDTRMGGSEQLDVFSDSCLFAIDALGTLMNVDLTSCGYSDFDGVARDIEKRNDMNFKVFFLTDRSSALYKSRLREMLVFMDSGNSTWFAPSEDFAKVARFLKRALDKVSSEIACVLVVR